MTEDLEKICQQLEATAPLPADRATLEDRALDAAARETRKRGETVLPDVLGYVKRNHTNYQDLTVEIGADALLRKVEGGGGAGAGDAARLLEVKAHGLARRLIRDAYGDK